MRALWETAVVYGAIAVATGITAIHLATTPAQWLSRECFADPDDTMSVYSRYICRAEWSSYHDLDQTLSRVGRNFSYATWRRSENIEDNRADSERASDALSISAYRAALNKHTPTPTIMTVHQ
jgi:hypothetical protein